MPRQTAYSYIRFSKGLQAKGDSYRRQLESTREYCARNGMDLDENLHFSDIGVSGWEGKNVASGALGRFIDACKLGTVKEGSALVVESLDRLSRQSPIDAVQLFITLLRGCKVDLHVTQANKVFLSNSSTEGMDLMMAIVMMIRANEESETKSKRLREAWSQKRKRAKETKEFMRSDLPWWLIEKNGKIICPPDRKAVLIQVYKLTASGYSSAQVARLLNAKVRPTWRPQTRWSSVRVRGLVRSKGPQGILQATRKTRLAGRNYELLGYYPVVISKDLAAAARAVLEDNSRGNRGRPPQHIRPINLFRGLLRHNGRWARHATHQNGRRDPQTEIRGWNSYYECFDEDAEPAKGKLLFCISGKQLDPVIFSGLAELKPADLAPLETNSAKQQVVHLDNQIRSLHKATKNLVRSLERASSPALTERLSAIERELLDKETQREKIERLKTPKKLETGEFKTIVDNLQNHDIRARTAVALRRIVKRIDISRTFEGLPFSDDFRKRFVKQRKSILSTATLFNDPVAKNKRRKPLHILITFANGVSRYVGRIDSAQDQLISWRVESSANVG